MADDGVDLEKSTDDSRVDSGNSMDTDEVNFYRSMDLDFSKVIGAQKFCYLDLVRATYNFSENQQLGKGGFGLVYKGFLQELKSDVAVKRVSSDSKQGVKEYASEVKISSQLRHRNIVQLIGWCHERKELLLVYEFMPNSSLDSHLFKDNILLPSEVRFKIARGLASGLRYLHEELEKYVVHRDIKAANVMLDSDFNAKLGDFGLARLGDHGKVLEYTALAGTVGYVAPEYATTGRASKESDIYSFGVVALEIACGRKVIDSKAIRKDQLNLREWVWDLYGEGKLIEAADPRLNGEFDKQQMECLMVVGLWCSHPDSKFRPTIEKAIHVLDFVAPLPVLPSKMPIFSYFASLSTSSSGTHFMGIQKQSPSAGYKEPLAAGGFGSLYKGFIRELNFGLWKRDRGRKREDNGFEMNDGPRIFSYQDLVRATNNFADSMLVEYDVYKGYLEELNSYVAIKRARIGGHHLQKYASELNIITQLRHKNIVQLIGYCHDETKFFIVCEFISNGSLDSHLSNKDRILKWEIRYKIAQDLASGLLHMHEVCELCVVHRNIKSSNVMLDSDFNAKLGGFCTARLMEHAQSHVTTSTIVGTLGYIAPEYHYALRFGRETDVYSFGIVALEIACGRRNLKASEEEHLLVKWAWDMYEKGKLLEAVDQRLNGDFNEQQVKRLILVGVWCTNPEPSLRPSIRQAIQVLNCEPPSLMPKYLASLFFWSMRGNDMAERQNPYPGSISETTLLIGR